MSASAPSGSASSDDPAELVAWRRLCDELATVGERICAPDFPTDPRDRAEGFRHLLRLLTFATQWSVEFGDPDFPAFVRTTDDAVMFGGPSADNRNLRARVDGEGTYRIRGNIGSAFDVLFSATGGDMALGETSVSDERSASMLDVADDGSFELLVSNAEQPGNWLPMATSTRRIQVRQIFTDWSTQEPGWFDIERLDRNDAYPTPLDSERIEVMLDDVGRWVSTSAVYWNDYQRELRTRVAVNTLQPPTAQEGGGLSIRYGFGWWQLQPDEALVIEFAVPPARYWSLQPYSVAWFEALDYRNHQTTINNAQAHTDGRTVRVIVSAVDPRVANWIDTCGHPQGQLILRWIWAEPGAVADTPVCTVVPLEQVLGPVIGTVLATGRVEPPIDRGAIVRARRISVARRHRR